MRVTNDMIAVTGESAGGGLTAAITLHARDKGDVNVAFHMPLCPMIDDLNNWFQHALQHYTTPQDG